MKSVVTLALSRRASALAFAAPAILTLTTIAHAQAPARDTVRADSGRAQRLERVMISAVRASGTAPISEKTLNDVGSAAGI
jgi:hypothetical protein